MSIFRMCEKTRIACVKLSAELKKIFNKKSICDSLKTLYKIISVISTLSIFAGVILFLWGKITRNNLSDNNLVMKQIRKETGEVFINSITTADIHGFGNNSIIVTAADTNFPGKPANSFIILDTVNNRVLGNMNDLLGIKSSYKVTLSHKLRYGETELMPTNVKVEDICGDSTKEILVMYEVLQSTYGAQFPAIYRYSYEKEKYELFGTFPIPYYEDNSLISPRTGEPFGYQVLWHYSSFDGYVPEECGDATPGVLADDEREYCLPCYSQFCKAYWAHYGRMQALIVSYRVAGSDQANINIYHPHISDNKLEWGLARSFDNTGFLWNISAGDIQRFLDDNDEGWELEEECLNY